MNEYYEFINQIKNLFIFTSGYLTATIIQTIIVMHCSVKYIKRDDKMPHNVYLNMRCGDLRWVVMNPKTWRDMLEGLFLLIVYRAGEGYVKPHDKVRVKIILTTLLVITLILIISGLWYSFNIIPPTE